MYLAVRLLVAWGANILALIVADWVFSGFTIERWGSLLLAGAVFGLANVFLKPLLTFIAPLARQSLPVRSCPRVGVHIGWT